MLRRIDALNDGGFFASFSQADDCRDFRRINVIYGANGSGKTCLAQAFAATCDDQDARNRLTVTIEENGRRRKATTSDGVFERICVFGEDYVSKNHRFHDSQHPDMQAILTIGEKSAEAEDRLITLRERVETAAVRREAANASRDEAKKQRDGLLAKASENVVADLTKLGGQYQSRSHYSVKKVELRLRDNQDEWVLLTADELARERAIVNAPKQDPVEFSQADLAAPNETSIRQLLETSASNVVLDTLNRHPEATQWVQEGSSLHDGIAECLFCGSLLTDERKRQIDQHFSTEVQELEAGIHDAINSLKALANNGAACVQSMPPTSALYEDLRDSYREARGASEKQLDVQRQWIDALRERLQRKLMNVLRPDMEEVVAPPSVDGTKVSAIIGQHNTRAYNHEANLNKAAARIEEHHLLQAATEVDKLDRIIDETTQTVEWLGTEIASLEGEIASLENVEGDPTPSADVLNREVARLLGRDELSFSLVGARYQVLRNGKPAIGLSEGECTAIILVHFMETVARHESLGEKPIVIIDDPVSSLDSGVFLGVSTYIWSECITKRRAAQVFLLTHNFELFRQWGIQLDRLSGALRREFPFLTYELSTRRETVNGMLIRSPVIAEWPPQGVSRQKALSSYLHAFMTLAEAKTRLDESQSLDSLLDAQLLFPNVMRRVLEGFIGFKRPELAGNFTKGMRECGQMLADVGYEGDADALRFWLTRFAHVYSHNENLGIETVNDPNEIVPALAAVFEFMNALDSRHFEGLCQAAKIDGDAILRGVRQRVNITD